MKKILILYFFLTLTNISIVAQEKNDSILNVNIDSLLTKYHLMGVKIFVKKVGVFSYKDKTLSLKRSDFDDKLLITLSRSVSLSENNFGAKFDYKLSERWIFRGESYRRSWGQQSGMNVLYQIEY
jgi:hypothetical protein